MEIAVDEFIQERNEKVLMLTELDLEKSAVRDQRINNSCSKDGGECEGWYQTGCKK
jgi:DNA sulfur modification protein DndC